MAPACSPSPQKARQEKLLRVAVLGDSWVSSWADEWVLESALPAGLKAGLRANTSSDIELIVAGFPGFTADRLLSLAERCRLRCLARLSTLNGGDELPWYGDLTSSLLAAGVPSLCKDGQGVNEHVDVVVIIAGYNDLSHDEADAKQVYTSLSRLQEIYAARGVRSVLVTLGQGRPQFEEQRQLLNHWLLQKCLAVDCDALVARLGDDDWENMEHLTQEGSWALGFLLADHVSGRFSERNRGRNCKDSCKQSSQWASEGTSQRYKRGGSKRRHNWRQEAFNVRKRCRRAR